VSYSKQILAGVATGVVVGLVLGDLAGSLKVAADAYLKLLQMTVLPYVVVSIIIGLGSLSGAQAKRLALRGGAVLLLLWALALAVVFVFPLMLPPQQTASFFSTTLLAPREPFDFVGLYIPSNPFNALANNVVPAVVLFSAFLGVSLIAVPDKQPLLDVFAVAEKAMARVMKLVARLMPLGLFFITATAAGTISVEELQRLQVYLLSYIAVSLLLGLWILPGLVSALTPIPYRAVLGRTRDALLTAFLTGSLFIVLPMLIDATKALLREYRPDNPEVESLPNVIVATSFNFPHAGKLLALTFILFAGWFSDAVVPGRDYPKLAATGLLVLFGNINVAVPFLLDLFGIPADTFHLFNVTSVVNARFGTLVAGSHTIAVALLGTWALAGGWQVDARRVGRYAAVTALLGVATVVGMQTLLGRTLSNEYDRDKVIAAMQLLVTRDPAVEYRRSADVPAEANTAPALDRIRFRGSVRVGYLPDSLPFVYENAAGRLVGYDVEMAHVLASELGVTLALVPVERERLVERLESGYCDVVMSGLAVTPARAADLRLSTAYLDETLALVVRDEARDEFATWAGIRAMGQLSIRVPRVNYYVNKLQQELPHAKLVVVEGTSDLFKGASGADVIALTAERGSTLTLLNPAYSVVVPQPGVLKVPLAYAMASRETRLASFVDTWIALKQKDGTADRLFAHWILGRSAEVHRRRWSVIRDVLHWDRSP
jgi:Na+/H+-dicarboxylate symporter/ABC-type amino acid transport substrate-binding protein